MLVAMEKPFYTLSEAANLVGCTISDLTHLAAKDEVSFLIGVPDGTRFQVFDADTHCTEAPALLEPQLLALSTTQCQKVVLNGHTAQSDFRWGYLIAPNGTLQLLKPSYGKGGRLEHGWAYWRVYLGSCVKEIELIPERLFVMGEDVRRMVAAKLQATFQDVPKKRSSKARESLPKESDSAASLEENELQVDTANQQQSLSIAKIEDVPASTATLAHQPVSADAPSRPLVFIRLKQVIGRTGLSRSAIYDKLDPKSPRHDPTFPKQRQLGTGSVAWVETEIEDWLASRRMGGRAN